MGMCIGVGGGAVTVQSHPISSAAPAHLRIPSLPPSTPPPPAPLHPLHAHTLLSFLLEALSEPSYTPSTSNINTHTHTHALALASPTAQNGFSSCQNLQCAPG